MVCITTMVCYYGIVEFSVGDKQCLLLFWRISNYKKLQTTFCSVYYDHKGYNYTLDE